MYAPVIPYYIAQIYYMKKDYDKVVSYVTKSLDKSDVLYKDELNFCLARFIFNEANMKSASHFSKTYVAKSSKARKEDIYQLAYCQYQTGAYTKAIENFKHN